MSSQTICWQPIWNEAHPGLGLEHLVLEDGLADSVILGFTEDGQPFRVDYHLSWDDAWQLTEAKVTRQIGPAQKSLVLTTNGAGDWRDGSGRPRADRAGCIDIDIWPTPFTNTFPIRRAPPPTLNERREYSMAWVDAISGPEITVKPMRQGYTRLQPNLYRYENLDGSGFTALLPVDDYGLIQDYEGIFRRLYPR